MTDPTGTPNLGLPGLGPAREARLREAGYTTLESLARLVPSFLLEGLEVTPAHELEPGLEAVVEGTVKAVTLRRFAGRSRVGLRVVDALGAELELVIWNQPWTAKQHPVDSPVRARGLVKKKGQTLPEFLVQRFEKPEAPMAAGACEPRYPSIEGVGEKILRAACAEAARRLSGQVQETLDEATLRRTNCCPCHRLC